MTQNIYDDPQFFAGYSKLRRSIEGLDGAPEWPALLAMLPDLAGSTVIDLGCGFGWFCRFARTAGARQVVGLDVSENMLERARATTADPAIVYRRCDLEALSLPQGAFDVAFSSLTLHYLENLAPLLRELDRALVPGGRLVFSAEHPIYTAPRVPGWKVDDGRPSWPVDSYLQEGQRQTDWLTKGVMKRHRTVATYLNLLIAAGFTVRRIEEWGPTDTQIAAHPDWARERHRPAFLLVAAER